MSHPGYRKHKSRLEKARSLQESAMTEAGALLFAALIFMTLTAAVFGQDAVPGRRAHYTVKFYRGDYRDRQEKAYKDGAICYIEEHFNATDDPGTNYALVLTAEGASDFTGKWAQDYVDRVAAKFSIPKGYDNGIKVVKDGDRGYGNLRYSKMPAILLEPFFISNSEGLKWAESRQDDLAGIILDSIRECFPNGGLVAFSVGHRYKVSNPADNGAVPAEGKYETIYNESVLKKAAQILDPDYRVSMLKDSPHYYKLFNEICNLVENNFYDSSFIRDKFRGIRETYLENAGEVRSDREFSRVINYMLAQMHSSHTNYYIRDDPEYYQLASVFSARPEIERLFNHREIKYYSPGFCLREIDGRIFIISVLSGSAAERAGLRMGDEIVPPGEPFRGAPSYVRDSGEILLRVRRAAGGMPFDVRLKASLENPSEEFLKAERDSERIIESGQKKIGYIHVWSFAGIEYFDELSEALSVGKLKDADALILDLRDGWGGADAEYLNIFNQNVPPLTMIDREGKSVSCDRQWRKPVVMLINGRTRSGKEILAYGFRRYGLGTLIGEKTAGATLGGRLFVVSDGSLLYLASVGTLIDGKNLEGVGVEPHIAVPMEVRHCEGKDIQLEKALEFLCSPAGK